MILILSNINFNLFSIKHIQNPNGSWKIGRKEFWRALLDKENNLEVKSIQNCFNQALDFFDNFHLGYQYYKNIIPTCHSFSWLTILPSSNLVSYLCKRVCSKPSLKWIPKEVWNLGNTLVLESRNGILIFNHIFSDSFSTLSAFGNGLAEQESS